MKTSNVLSTLLLGSLAAAAPLDKRAYSTKTEVVYETVLVFTTVWAGEGPNVAEATIGFHNERPSQPSQPASSQALPTSTAPAYTPPAVPKPSSVYVTPPPPSSAPAPPPAPTSIYTPPPPPPPSSAPAPAPAPSSVYVAPAPAPSAPAPAPAPAPPAQPPSNPPATGNWHAGDITIYDGLGALGACGKPINDEEATCAIAQGSWGASTYDVMTGEATNKRCGQKITLEYNGRTADCVITDLCPGCSGMFDIDMTYSVWKKLTGTDEKTRFQAKWVEA